MYLLLGNAALLFPAVMMRQTRGMVCPVEEGIKGEEWGRKRLGRKGVKKEFVVTYLRNNYFDFTVPPAVALLTNKRS
jgi:hypothetical protein